MIGKLFLFLMVMLMMAILTTKSGLLCRVFLKNQAAYKLRSRNKLNSVGITIIDWDLNLIYYLMQLQNTLSGGGGLLFRNFFLVLHYLPNLKLVVFLLLIPYLKHLVLSRLFALISNNALNIPSTSFLYESFCYFALKSTEDGICFELTLMEYFLFF